jgi:hypothetical protein
MFYFITDFSQLRLCHAADIVQSSLAKALHSTHTHTPHTPAQGAIPPSLSQSMSVGSHGDSDHSDRVRAAQIKEQKELQLLETRIREAAVQSAMGMGKGSGTGPVGGHAGIPQGDKGLKQLEELNKERESEYRTLASRYNESEEKDTIDDAERNRGESSFVHTVCLSVSVCCYVLFCVLQFVLTKHRTISIFCSILLCLILFCSMLFCSVNTFFPSTNTVLPQRVHSNPFYSPTHKTDQHSLKLSP